MKQNLLNNKSKPLSDADLIALFAKNSEKAFRLIFNKYYKNLKVKFDNSNEYTMLSKEDIIQDAFVVLFESIREGKITDTQEGCILRYLMKTVSTKLKAEYRKYQKLKTNSLTPELESLLVDEGELPLERTELGEIVKRVRFALEKLDEKCRDRILYKNHGLSHAEIAEEVGGNAQSSSVLLARCRAKFKQIYKMLLNT